MHRGLLGRKLGMSSLFSPEGQQVPVTVLEVGPCVLTQVKTRATDGYDALQFTDDVNQLKLDFDNSDWIPIEFYEDEVISCQKLYFPEGFEYNFMMDIIDAVEIDTHMGYVTHIDGTGLSSAGRAFEYDGSHKGVEAVGYMDVATPTAISTYEQVYISSKGFIPFGMWYLPMSMIQDGADDTLDTTAYSRIVLKMTSSASASTSSTPSIIAEYLVTA